MPKDYITYLPSKKTFTVSPTFSIHTRETFINKKLNPSLKSIANSSSSGSSSCNPGSGPGTKSLCNDSGEISTSK